MSPLEKELESALLNRYEEWKKIDYRAGFFIRMLKPSDRIYKGPVGTLKHLLSKTPTERSGFQRLRRVGRLDLTTEALLKDRKWHSLFEEWEIARAAERLRLGG